MKSLILYVLATFALFFLTSTAINGFIGVKADMAKHNGTYGNSQYIDIYEDFDFYDISLDNPMFYPKAGGGYEFRIDYPKAIEFDGTTNKYNLLVNNTPCRITESSGSQLRGSWIQSFYDLSWDSQHICDITLTIRFIFSHTTITLLIETDITAKEYGYLRQYISVDGLRVRIIAEQYNTPQLAEVPA